MRTAVYLLSTMVACSSTDGTDSGGSSEAPQVQASIQVLDPMDGGGWAGITISGGGTEVETEAGGVAAVSVTAEAPFSLRLVAEDILEHVLYGTATSHDFELITFAGSPSTSNTVLGMLGLSWAADTGMLVVGVDYEDWSAVSGAEVSVSDPEAESFVLGSGGMPALGDTIPSGGMGMVSFASVGVGDVSVTLSPPDGVSCAPHPGGADYPTVPIEAEVVTVISYRCSTP